MNKKFYTLLLVAIAASIFAQARTLNKAVANGTNWSAVTTWSQGRIPANGDSIVVPGGYTIWLDIQTSLGNVYLTIGGTLEVDKNSGLTLDNASVISILSGGTLSTTHPSSTEVLSIGGANKYVGNVDGSISGPAIASSSTGVSPSGFSANPVTLPVTFVSFSAVRTGNRAVTLEWNTVNEFDNSHFEVERSLNGSDWTTIGTVISGPSAQEDSYSFTDESAGSTEIELWYRLRQVDMDGHYLYSKIVLVSSTTTAARPTIVAAGTTIDILFGQPITGRITVRLMSMSGQVLQQETVDAASSTMSISASHLPAGIYVVYLTNGKSWSTARKVML